jgi:putative addiction module component (TIGR02574 family)
VEGIASAEEHTVLDEAMKRDLERRLEAYREQPRSGSPWHEVAARIRGATS